MQVSNDAIEYKKYRIGQTCISEVQRVRLSLSNCMMRVLSLYDSSPNVSSSAMASSKAYTGDESNKNKLEMQ